MYVVFTDCVLGLLNFGGIRSFQCSGKKYSILKWKQPIVPTVGNQLTKVMASNHRQTES